MINIELITKSNTLISLFSIDYLDVMSVNSNSLFFEMKNWITPFSTLFRRWIFKV